MVGYLPLGTSTERSVDRFQRVFHLFTVSEELQRIKEGVLAAGVHSYVALANQIEVGDLAIYTS